MPVTVMMPITTPEDGEARAHLVGADGLEAHADGLAHRHQDGVALDRAAEERGHAHSFRSATTGSSAAARLAG